MTTARPRLGIFGGSFDPPHLGHLFMAFDAMEAMALERVVWVPAWRNPLKTTGPGAPGEVRLAMVTAMVSGFPAFTVDPTEVNGTAPVYSVDTVRRLQAAESNEADWFFIIGADNVPDLPRWKALDELCARLTFLAVARGDSPVGHEDVPAAAEGRVTFVRRHTLALSSSELRDRRRQGQRIDLFLPPAVHALIVKHDLYSTPATPA